MIEMSDFKNNRGGGNPGGLSISIDEDEDMETQYDNDKRRKGGTPYAAFNETR